MRIRSIMYVWPTMTLLTSFWDPVDERAPRATISLSSRASTIGASYRHDFAPNLVRRTHEVAAKARGTTALFPAFSTPGAAQTRTFCRQRYRLEPTAAPSAMAPPVVLVGQQSKDAQKDGAIPGKISAVPLHDCLITALYADGRGLSRRPLARANFRNGADIAGPVLTDGARR